MARDPQLQALLDLHRDADGNGLLVGPDCPDCEREHVAHYRCVKCEARIITSGRFRWSWQGKGHFHQANDEAALNAAIDGPCEKDGTHHVCVPVTD